MTIDPDSDRAVFLQVADIIRSKIDNGELSPGSPIPSESSLIQEFGIARETVRRAVARLRSEGRIYTIQGQGSFVTGGEEVTTVRFGEGAQIQARKPTPAEQREWKIPETVPVFVITDSEGNPAVFPADRNVIVFGDD